MQVLFWDFTNTHPGDSVNNQVYYIRDLPAKPKGKVKVNISNIPSGNYLLEVYKVGYKVNDPYTTYLSLNKPSQLTKQQVDYIKKQNNGAPVATETVRIGASKVFSKEFAIRENDVFLINLVKR